MTRDEAILAAVRKVEAAMTACRDTAEAVAAAESAVNQASVSRGKASDGLRDAKAELFNLISADPVATLPRGREFI